MTRYLFSSESVTEGHPDKICDQISDRILDAHLSEDPDARVACECFITTGMVLVGGEISSKAKVNYSSIVRETLTDIGYTRAKFGFDAETCAVLVSLDEQSSDIALGVDEGLESKSLQEEVGYGAGDQGLMFGYACKETEDYMPLSLHLAHRLCQRLAEVRKTNLLPLLRPDGKAQVTVEYEGHQALSVHTIVLSTQHDESYTYDRLYEDIKKYVIEAVIPQHLLQNTRILINPTGRFVIGGPQGDTGLTGRKIIVDTYGGAAAHGGGAFSGKDPTKVDRSAAYMARYIAKNLVAANLADKIQVQLAYAIGVAKPVSVHLESFGTEKIALDKMVQAVIQHFPLTPKGIIEHLDLKKPRYHAVAAYGHFGRTDLDLPWERLDKVEELKKFL